jgi:Tfp pilus assembly protein PilF
MTMPQIRVPVCLLAMAVALAAADSYAAEAERDAGKAEAQPQPRSEAEPQAETQTEARPETFHLGPVEDVRGRTVEVPAGKKPAVLLFLMPGQDQSRKALVQVRAALEGKSDAQLVAVVSGEGTAEAAGTLADEVPGPVVVDPDYRLADQMSVMAWPTTQVLTPDGRKVGHLPGLPKSFSKDLASYLQYAAGAIDRRALQQRLSVSQAVTDDPVQMAHRHLEVANRQLAKGLIPEAALEIERGLKLAPADAELRLAKARVLLMDGKPEQALAMLDSIDRTSVPPWQIDSLRGRILVALGKWEEADKVLRRAVGLNPEPAEAFYALGLLHAHRGDWKDAAEAFRSAVENTPTGRTLKPRAVPKGIAPAAADRAP